MDLLKSFWSVALFSLLLAPPAAGSSQVGAVTFVPELVFGGSSQGIGHLKLGFGKARPFTVRSRGTRQADGGLKLDQVVRFDGEPPLYRSWLMWSTSAGNYSATLTDAAGPVVGRAVGSRFTLQYPLNHWGLVMHQTLDLAPDGKTIANLASIRWLGLQIGQLTETITLKR